MTSWTSMGVLRLCRGVRGVDGETPEGDGGEENLKVDVNAEG